MEPCGCEYHPLIGDGWQHCRRCGSPSSADNPISRRGICLPCADKAVFASIYQMQKHRGPAYRHWRYGQLRYAQKLLNEPDE